MSKVKCPSCKESWVTINPGVIVNQVQVVSRCTKCKEAVTIKITVQKGKEVML